MKKAFVLLGLVSLALLAAAAVERRGDDCPSTPDCPCAQAR